jgi:ADP-ribose pyrophosphatase
MQSYKLEKFEEKKLSSREVFKGVLLHAFSDEVSLPDGRHAIREVIRHTGAVCVVPLTDKGEVITVSQFRYPHKQILLEIPAGKLDSKQEDPLEAAKRELREETGAIAGKIVELGLLYTTPAFVDEVIHMYLATDLTFTEQDLDDDENLAVDRIPLDEFADMILAGKVPDAKTQAAVMRVWAMKQKNMI